MGIWLEIPVHQHIFEKQFFARKATLREVGSEVKAGPIRVECIIEHIVGTVRNETAQQSCDIPSELLAELTRLATTEKSHGSDYLDSVDQLLVRIIAALSRKDEAEIFRLMREAKRLGTFPGVLQYVCERTKKAIEE